MFENTVLVPEKQKVACDDNMSKCCTVNATK